VDLRPSISCLCSNTHQNQFCNTLPNRLSAQSNAYPQQQCVGEYPNYCATIAEESQQFEAYMKNNPPAIVEAVKQFIDNYIGHND
jgi:hypothetical protein